ncbi:MAG: DUF1460 domain-containing protein [Candidatus Melainabacteria bacterium]|nr:DUF1460 domain-containing protein [Candidatus Melainabacteria bacterium]
MFSRRIFISSLILLFLTASNSQCGWSATNDAVQGSAVFNRIVSQSNSNNWRALPIGELMGQVAKQLEGTPYKSNSLDSSPDREVCTVNLDGLDCVTFFENVLGFVRMIKKGERTQNDLVKQVTSTRYRGGIVGDYTSRLHYLSDWFYENESKHVVKVLSDLPGAETLKCKIRFMSTHPASYEQLVKYPNLVAKIKQQEDAINKRPVKFVPMSKMAAAEPLLQTGDIVAICTTIPGLDVAHTGLVVRTADGVAHFMDASSKFRKVTLEAGSISQYLSRNKTWTGAIFARPLEP